MAKKVKKKPRSGQKDKQGATPLQNDPTEQSIPAKTKTVKDADKERKICSHFDKDIDLAKVTLRISSAEHIKCEDCGLSVTEKRGKKGKGNQGKKKGGSSVDSKSASKAVWICLECGLFFCGGIGFPTIPQSHAVRHAKQTRHQLAIQFENLRLRWCFPCNTLIPVEKSSESGESLDLFSDIVKVIKERSTEKVSVNVEDVWFGSGSILNEIKSENTPFHFDGTSGYFVSGLVNLGNTCFFNSIMQNLLAMERLRNHYLELNESVGPLTVSLKKILMETFSGSGLKNVINPRSLFGCVCAKAPQFKGYQQHDGHELLRCLLDGLCNEELSAKKRISRENGTSANKEPTFVDASFGGQLCSTVSCLDCGHSSKVFEPFLDLSLPVPTTRPPSKKAKQPISRAKKQKLPPKRNGCYRPKISKDVGLSASPSVPDSSANDAAPFPSEYIIPNAKQPGDAVDDSVGENVAIETKNMGSPSMISVEEVEKKPILENAMDNSSWLDYLETDFVSNDDGMTSKCNEIEAFYDAEEKGDCQMNESVKDGTESSSQIVEGTVTTTDLSEIFSWLDFVEVGEVGHDHNIVSKVEDDSVHENIRGEVNPSGSVSQNICEESNCSTGNSRENEQSLQVRGSEVIFLPYKEENYSNDEILTGEGEVSSSAIGCEQVQGSEVILLPYKEENCPNDKILTGEREVSSSAIGCEQVQGSEVILLPYKQKNCSNDEILTGEREVSSSTIGWEQDSLGFDGFGDLFNEPEVVKGPSVKPKSNDSSFLANAGPVVGNTSESDLDEVDNSNSQVSIESCLAYFTKAELLSISEHGWNCENCSKAMKDQKRQSRKKQQKAADIINQNEVDNSLRGIPSGLGSDSSCPSEVGSTSNGDSTKKVVSPKAEEDANSEKVDQILEASNSQDSNGLAQVPSYENVSGISTSVCSVNDSPLAVCAVDEVRQNESQMSGEGSETEGIGDEETNSESVKVKRDATKRIIINKAPSILTIHLKRFSQDARGRLSKLNGHVDFKENIDLRPYMDPRCEEIDEYKYRLSGVVEHSGTMRGGHYIAYVRGSKKSENGDNSMWYYASDAHVKQVSLQQVLNCEAYILFYEKI